MIQITISIGDRKLPLNASRLPRRRRPSAPLSPAVKSVCGWDLVSDEGRPASTLLGLIDIVSTVDKVENERISRFTSRANPDKTFTFYGRTGPFCEAMKSLCVRIAPAAPG